MIIFVTASHQTGLDTRSKARRSIKVGIKGRGRSGTSRESNPASHWPTKCKLTTIMISITTVHIHMQKHRRTLLFRYEPFINFLTSVRRHEERDTILKNLLYYTMLTTSFNGRNPTQWQELNFRLPWSNLKIPTAWSNPNFSIPWSELNFYCLPLR